MLSEKAQTKHIKTLCFSCKAYALIDCFFFVVVVLRLLDQTLLRTAWLRFLTQILLILGYSLSIVKNNGRIFSQQRKKILNCNIKVYTVYIHSNIHSKETTEIFGLN